MTDQPTAGNSDARSPEDLRRLLDRTIEERDRLARELLECEQDLANALGAAAQDGEAVALRTDDSDLEVDVLRRVADNLRAENAALRASTSWRITRPLRALSTAVRRLR